ncbi:MAG TPA: ATP-binding protein [Desulfobacterales bacterium]|nr:ATP-binding protein [Desulfobacterales bacterium]
MSDDKVFFELTNRLSELEALHDNLKNFGQSVGLSRKAIFEINLVMEEIFTNIVTYAYDNDDEHRIGFFLSHEKGMMVIRIEDTGMSFNPLCARTPDLECALEDRKIGGLGVYLAKHFMDHIDYVRCGNKNILTLKKSVI